MKFFHVDVFSAKPMSGNGLTVVFPEQQLNDKTLLELTQKFRQFETVFVFARNQEGAFPVRIFTMDEELTFAGHPILGASAVIHNLFFPSQNTAQILFDLSGRTLKTESSFSDGLCNVTMNQGSPEFIRKVEKSYYSGIAEALNIREGDIEENFPVEVISTGLPYLLVPVRNSLADSKIMIKDFEKYLANFGAKFVYLFDPRTLECRTWDNNGLTEDIATGSAAGPLCAYLVKNGLKKSNEIIDIQQGRFVNRPSTIQGWIAENPQGQEVFIRGYVSFFASGKVNDRSNIIFNSAGSMNFEPAKKPELFEPGDENIWTDSYISQRLLEAHLNTDYDGASRKITTIKQTVEWINSMLPREARILDLGCGPGLYAEQLAQLGHRVTGIDINPYSVAYALESAKKKGLKINYINGSYLEINLDEQFDAILMIYCDLGTHSNENRDKILRQVKKYLKPGGKLIFDVFNEKLTEEKKETRSWEYCDKAGFWNDKPHLVLSETFHYQEASLFCYQYLVIAGTGQKIYRVWEHYYTESEIKQLLTEQGYEILKLETGLVPKNSFTSNEVMFLICKAKTIFS